MNFEGPATIPILPGYRKLDISLTFAQTPVFKSTARNRVLVTGRRWGKTTLDLTELINSAARYPMSENWYVGPTMEQAIDVCWDALLNCLGGQSSLIRAKSVSDRWIEIYNRSVISLKSGLAYDRMRGKGLYRPVKLVVFDEMRHIPMDAYTKVVRPLLADQKIVANYDSPGRALFTGTPGGFDDFKDLFDKASLANNTQWQAFQSTSIEGGNISAEEIAQMRLDLTERDFRQELEASFEALTGRCYHAFVPKPFPLGNVDSAIGVVPDMPLMVGMDFNVSPMTCTISQRRLVGNMYESHTFDEISINDSNTPEMILEIKRRYPQHKIIVFPDPHSSGSRSTKTEVVGQTDVTLLRAAGFQVFMPPAKFYAVRDRINTVNGMLCNANGLRRAKIHPRCVTLIKCFNGLTYKEGTNLPDKTLGIEHIGDGYGYYIMGAFPPGIYTTTVKELIL